MISILIPVYNCDVNKLVNAIHDQFEKLAYKFEIICIEDGSSAAFILQNRPIKKLSCTKQIISSINVGRVKVRKLLLEEARFDWILFLDADIFPKTETFIFKYTQSIQNNHQAVFGGICYHSEIPEPKYMLRWKYGLYKEQKTASLRNRNPYKQIVSANMLIKKDVLMEIHPELKSDGYGMDNYLGSLLKEKSICLTHIDNEVYHLGIDTSEDFLEKTKQAVEILLKLFHEGRIIKSDNTLLKYFKIIKTSRSNTLFAKTFEIFKTKLEKNLLGPNPSINLFQLYKLGYICFKDLHQ